MPRSHRRRPCVSSSPGLVLCCSSSGRPTEGPGPPRVEPSAQLSSLIHLAKHSLSLGQLRGTLLVVPGAQRPLLSSRSPPIAGVWECIAQRRFDCTAARAHTLCQISAGRLPCRAVSKAWLRANLLKRPPATEWVPWRPRAPPGTWAPAPQNISFPGGISRNRRGEPCGFGCDGVTC